MAVRKSKHITSSPKKPTSIVSFERANVAAQQLSRAIGESSWLRSIVIETDTRKGYVITLRVAVGAHIPPIPSDQNGVSIRVIRHGMARAM